MSAVEKRGYRLASEVNSEEHGHAPVSSEAWGRKWDLISSVCLLPPPLTDQSRRRTLKETGGRTVGGLENLFSSRLLRWFW